MTSPASFRRAAPRAALALLLLGPALGHIAGSMGYATVSLSGGTVRYSLTLGPDALAAASREAPGTRPAPRVGYDALASLVARKVAISADGERCEPVPGTVTPPSPDRANAVVIVDYACPGAPRELVLRDDLSEAIGRDYHTIVRVEAPENVQQYTLESDRREARVAVAAPTSGRTPEVSALSGVFAFFRLGVEHILTGIDHLLFVLALVLGDGGGIGSLFAVVTAFTVAHSITLALAVLGAVSPPPWIIEPVIALSIVYVAAENVFLKRTASWRWAVGFVFGLVHGFGFAGALLELDLPAAALAGALVSFNLGVEAGQAAVIAAFLAGLLWLRGFAWERQAVTGISTFVLVAGLAFLIDRLLVAAGG